MLFSIQHTRLLAGVLSLLWLVGCSHTVSRESLPREVVQQVELTDTPFFAQERYQCGPASLAMVLAQRGMDVTTDELVSRVYLPGRQGSVVPEMIATARSYGMVVYELPPSLDALLREVAAGNPVLVLQNLGLSWLPKWHYAVVVGYDIASQQIILRSGVTERQRISFGLFERTWQRGRRWGMILLLPGSLPASNDYVRYQKGAYGLEQTGQGNEALIAYRAAVERWPCEPLAWLALSNLHYAEERFGEAVGVLKSGLHHHPQAAQLWNNLAYALGRIGCVAAARSAVNCAVALAPQERGYLESRDEIAAMESRMVPGKCPLISCSAAVP